MDKSMDELKKLLDMLERAYNGPICSQEEWDMEVISVRIREVVQKYSLQGSYDRENPVNMDDELADRFFQAGVDLAERTGLLCIDTERIIKCSAEEIADALSSQPSEVHLGKGKDGVVLRRRRPEDGQKPICKGIIGTPFTEDIYVDLTAAICSIPEVDCISGATLMSAYGHEILGSTPFESAAGYLEAKLKRQALERVGRPGMSVTAAENSPSAYGLLSSMGVPGGFDPEKDIVSILGMAELKTGMDLFHKAVHTVQCGGQLRGGQVAMIGGYGGGVEAAVVLSVAINLLYRTIFGIVYDGGNVLDVRYSGSCGSFGIWGLSMAKQAISRNSNFLPDGITTQVSGPNTEMFMWETAAGVLTNIVSGAALNFGPYPSGGLRADYLTPLDVKFFAELGIAGAKMTRKQVNGIVKELIPRYEKDLFTPPLGNSIHECYEVSTMTPHDDIQALYERCRDELIGLGVPL